MKPLKLIIILSVSILLSSNCVGADALEYGSHLSSPDDNYTVTYLGSQVRFVDLSGSTTFDPIGVFPVYKMKWLANSKALLTIEHLAGGSEAVLIRLEGNRWHRIELDPPGGPYERMAVVNVEIEPKTAVITYKLLRHEAKSVKHLFYSFKLDPETLQRADENTKAVSPPRFEKVKAFGTSSDG